MNIVLRPVIKNRLDMLYIPERASTKAIVAALQVELARRTVEVFVMKSSQHGMEWTDRLIVGDSRIIMDSAVGCDLMTGKVQMIYLDPPDPTREADLILCRGLLHESGGIFVRISDEDHPGLRSVIDAVFGSDNCCGIVTLEETSYRKPVADCLVWYSRDVSKVECQQLLVLLHFQAQYPTVFGEGRARRKRCGILLH